MSYSIHYAPRLPREDHSRDTLFFRWMTAGFALATVCTVRTLWPEGREILKGWFAGTGKSEIDRATMVLAQSVAAGEGWYAGLAGFCRSILGLA